MKRIISYVHIIVTVKQLIDGIIFAVLGSAIFAYILNRDKKVILPDKLVLRRRTSEGSNGVLTLGVLLGNPGKEWIYDVQCILNCSYTKSASEGIVQRNSEVVLKEERDSKKVNANNVAKIVYKSICEKLKQWDDTDKLFKT